MDCFSRLVGFVITVLFVLLSNSFSFAQDTPSKWEVKGYYKNMFTAVGVGDSASLFENLVHNRINIAWYATDNFTFHAQFRNRLITGDFINQPGYRESINGNNDYFNMSANVVTNPSVLVNVMVDRLYGEWSKGKWEVKVGRQRVNWGINLAWNPNDIFNAYSFFDFDYEERRGSDAMRIIYYSGVASSWELAGKLAKNVDDWVGGGIRRINKWDYDFQFLGGIANGDFVLGTGWAGNIGLAGFKGEFTYLQPIIDTKVNAGYHNMFIGTVSIDYSFKNSLYLNGSVLYNSERPLHASFFGISNQTTSDFTMRNLSTYQWSSFVNASYQFTPLVYGGVAVMAFPGNNAVFLNPSLSYSLTQNMDLGLFGQILFDENPISGDYEAINPAGFLRLKWSF